MNCISGVAKTDKWLHFFPWLPCHSFILLHACMAGWEHKANTHKSSLPIFVFIIIIIILALSLSLLCISLLSMLSSSVPAFSDARVRDANDERRRSTSKKRQVHLHLLN